MLGFGFVCLFFKDTQVSTMYSEVAICENSWVYHAVSWDLWHLSKPVVNLQGYHMIQVLNDYETGRPKLCLKQSTIIPYIKKKKKKGNKALIQKMTTAAAVLFYGKKKI